MRCGATTSLRGVTDGRGSGFVAVVFCWGFACTPVPRRLQLTTGSRILYVGAMVFFSHCYDGGFSVYQRFPGNSKRLFFMAAARAPWYAHASECSCGEVVELMDAKL